MEKGDIPENANERNMISFSFLLQFQYIYALPNAYELNIYDSCVCQIARVLSQNLLENPMHAKDALISKFVPLPPKDLTLVRLLFTLSYATLLNFQ